MLVFIIPASLPEIENWVTLIVEVAIGLFIAISLFIYQSKTSKDLRDLIDRIKTTTEKIEKYDREQTEQIKSVKLYSLLKVQTNLSNIEDFLKNNLHQLMNLHGDLPSQEKYVTEMITRRDPWIAVISRMSEELVSELEVVRTHIPPTLHDSIKGCIELIQILYGLSPNFPSVAIVDNWIHRCNSGIQQMEKIRKDIGEILGPEKDFLMKILKTLNS